MDFKTANASIEDFYRRIYWQGQTAVTLSAPDYTLSYCGLPWQHSLNQLWLHHPEALNDDLLCTARDFFQPFKAQYSIVFNAASISPERPEVSDWLAERHCLERNSSPIFALRGLPHPPHVSQEAVFLRVQAERTDKFMSVIYDVFFMGAEISRNLVSQPRLDAPTVRHYLGYLDGRAAACQTILLHDGVAGVWNLGTLRAYRRQGVASALLLHGLREAAADGCPDSVLVASQMGRPLYEEMGYQWVGTNLFYGPGES